MMLDKSCLFGKGPNGNFSRNLFVVSSEYGAIPCDANAAIALEFRPEFLTIPMPFTGLER